MLISENYRAQNNALHENPNYGTIGKHHAEAIFRLIQLLVPKSFLDYGCGKGLLVEELRKIASGHELPKIALYDPCMLGCMSRPEPADLVACIDVLEHIEPECLDEVLDDLKRVILGFGYLTIAHRPSKKTLPDGRNAHLIQESYAWWKPKLKERFKVHTVVEGEKVSTFMVEQR